MTPIETYKYLKKKDLDLTAMMILERLAFYDRPILTGQMVTDATTNSAFASPATVYKYLAKLKERGFIGEVKEYSDARCTYIEITTKGKKLLKEYVNG
jgi:DNA-binding MarR family transcriptional regulator